MCAHVCQGPVKYRLLDAEVLLRDPPIFRQSLLKPCFEPCLKLKTQLSLASFYQELCVNRTFFCLWCVSRHSTCTAMAKPYLARGCILDLIGAIHRLSRQQDTCSGSSGWNHRTAVGAEALAASGGSEALWPRLFFWQVFWVVGMGPKIQATLFLWDVYIVYMTYQ